MNITLYPLHDYNNGKLNPFTIELDDLTDEDDYRAAISAGLWDNSTGGNVISTKCGMCDHIAIGQELDTCPECGNSAPAIDADGDADPYGMQHAATNEEFIVCDYEDVPAEYVGEYDLSSDFWNYKEFMDKTHLEPEAVAAGVYLGIPLDDIEEAFAGQYDSDEAFAEQLAEDIGAINHDATWPNDCIDWSRAAREIMYDYSAHDGYYFRRM